MPANAATHWIRVIGDGLIYDGPCIVRTIILWPHASSQYTDVYDGRDATSGTKFCRLDAFSAHTRHISLGQGVLFGRGIYVDTEDEEDETTVTFIPLNQLE